MSKPNTANVTPITSSADQSLADVAKKQRDMAEELEKLRAENERLKTRTNVCKIKVSEKGGVSVYGLGRFPVTLYQEQWLKLISIADEIRNFIRVNGAHLKTKE